MKLILVCLFLTLIVGTIETQWYLENNPNFLTQQNIGDQILTQGYIKIVHFMEPNCHYCPEMKPYLEKLEKQLKNDPLVTAKFYQLDCNKNKQLCQDFRITLMPYLIVFNKEGKVIQQLPGQRQAFSYTIQKVQQAISTMSFREYQQKRLSLFKHIRSQGHGSQPIQLPKKEPIQSGEVLEKVRTPQNKDINKSQQLNNNIQIKSNQQKIQQKKSDNNSIPTINTKIDIKQRKNDKDIQSKVKQQTQQKNNKVNVESLLPHQSRAKVVEEVLNTRQRRKMADALKISSKIGIVIMIIFFVAMGLYLKSIVTNFSNGRIVVRKAQNYAQQQQNPQQSKNDHAKNSL